MEESMESITLEKQFDSFEGREEYVATLDSLVKDFCSTPFTFEIDLDNGFKHNCNLYSVDYGDKVRNDNSGAPVSTDMIVKCVKIPTLSSFRRHVSRAMKFEEPDLRIQHGKVLTKGNIECNYKVYETEGDFARISRIGFKEKKSTTKFDIQLFNNRRAGLELSYHHDIHDKEKNRIADAIKILKSSGFDFTEDAKKSNHYSYWQHVSKDIESKDSGPLVIRDRKYTEDEIVDVVKNDCVGYLSAGPDRFFAFGNEFLREVVPHAYLARIKPKINFTDKLKFKLYDYDLEVRSHKLTSKKVMKLRDFRKSNVENRALYHLKFKISDLSDMLYCERWRMEPLAKDLYRKYSETDYITVLADKLENPYFMHHRGFISPNETQGHEVQLFLVGNLESTSKVNKYIKDNPKALPGLVKRLSNHRSEVIDNYFDEHINFVHYDTTSKERVSRVNLLY